MIRILLGIVHFFVPKISCSEDVTDRFSETLVTSERVVKDMKEKKSKLEHIVNQLKTGNHHG
jgi:hypothetical protein